MSLSRGRTCGACCCLSLFIVPWLTLALLYLYSWSQHPSFCDVDKARSGAAAVEERPKVYSFEDDGTVKTDWSSVSSGWNTACGEVPKDFSEEAAKYAAETGGWNIIQNDSAFKSNRWTKYNFNVMQVKSVKQSGDFPFGARAQSIATMVRALQVNLYFMPTATAEIAGPGILQYEVCAYFEDPSGKLPWRRLYKTTISPLGATDPFVQEMVEETGTPPTAEYDAVSHRYNDDGEGVGKARFKSQVAEGCAVWSQAESTMGLDTFFKLLTFAVLLACLGCAFGCKQGVFHEEETQKQDSALELTAHQA